MNIDRAIILFAISLISLALAGCGGGGGGSGSGENKDPTLSIDRTTVAITADTSEGYAGPTSQLQIMARNAPTTGFYYRYNYSRSAVSSASWSSGSGDTGSLTLAFYAPAVMGAGSYTDSVQIELCKDSACASQFAGSPATVAVTYTVTGNPQPVATFSVSPQSIAVESAADGTAVTSQVQTWIYNPPPYPTYSGVARRIGSVINQITGEAGSSSSIQWTLHLKGKDMIGAGIFQESLRFRLCFKSDCSLLSSDSPQYLPVRYNVLAEEGPDFTTRSVMGEASSLAYDATRTKLYAAFKAASPSNTSFVRIDPLTGQIDATLQLDGQPGPVALSDDGKYGYVAVALTDANDFVTEKIVQVDLASHAIVSTVNIPAANTSWTYLNDIAVSPGHPEQLAVTVHSASFSGIVVYVSGNKVAEFSAASVGQANTLQWSSSSRLHFYPIASDTLYTFAFDGSTLHTDSEYANFNRGCTLYSYNCGIGGIRYAAGHLYSGAGTIFDIASNMVTGHLALPSSISRAFVTVANGRAYYLYDQYPSSRMISMDVASLQPIVEARLSGVSFSSDNGNVPQVVSWGTDGLAFNASDRIVILKGSFVTQVYVQPGSSSILGGNASILSSTPEARTRSRIQKGETPSTL